MNRRLLLVMSLIIVLIAIGVAAVHMVEASGTIYIKADGSVEGTDKIQRVGDIYTFTDNIYDEIVVQRSSIVIDGNGYIVQGTGTINSRGIYLDGIGNVTIRNTNIKGFYYGVLLKSTSHNVLCLNSITENHEGGIGLYNSSYNSIVGNSITNNAYGIEVYPSSNNSIIGNNIKNNSYGIELYSSSNNSIIGNNITNNGNGIYLRYSSNNSVVGNNITNNGNGIYISSSSNNSISGNNIINNGEGLFLFSSSGSSIVGNNITANRWQGIALWWSSSNNISDNSITNNNDQGISLTVYSNYNKICRNNIINNTYGIHAKAGGWELGRPMSSSNNTVYHNNFINNQIQALNEELSTNVWDNGYPSGGNYWSDYTGLDANGDGIGDTTYVIDANNTDRYPLMSPLILPQYELVVSITAPSSISLGSSSSLDAIVTNQGPSDAINVKLVLFINGTTVKSTTLPLLQVGNSYTLSYHWTSTVKGVYNVTAYAHPMLSETSVENNKMTEFITVVAQPSGLAIDPIVLYALVIVVIAIATAVGFFMIRKKKKPSEKFVEYTCNIRSFIAMDNI